MKMNTSINSEFYAGYRQEVFDCEWLAYCGCPLLYDGGLCVNRTPEEVRCTTRYMKYHLSLAI